MVVIDALGDLSTHEILRIGMTPLGIQVIEAEDIKDAEFMINHGSEATVVLVNPTTDLAWIRSLRGKGSSIGVICVSHCSDTKLVVGALNAGADDYITTPFNRDVLQARLESVTRRATGAASSTVVCGPLSIEILSQIVSVHGKRIHLTSKEYQVLECMARRVGTTVSKERILSYVYADRWSEPGSKIIDVIVCKLRRKIQIASGGVITNVIHTIWGRGYCLRGTPPEDSSGNYSETTRSSIVSLLEQAGEMTSRDMSERLNVPTVIITNVLCIMQRQGVVAGDNLPERGGVKYWRLVQSPRAVA